MKLKTFLIIVLLNISLLFVPVIVNADVYNSVPGKHYKDAQTQMLLTMGSTLLKDVWKTTDAYIVITSHMSKISMKENIEGICLAIAEETGFFVRLESSEGFEYRCYPGGGGRWG